MCIRDRDDDQGDEDQHETDDIVGIARPAGNAHRAVDQFLGGQRVDVHIVIGLDAECHMQTVDVFDQINIIDDILDNLAESQRHDRQIVAAQTQDQMCIRDSV